MARIAITGATGFIGQQLLPHLIEQGHQLHLLSRQSKTYPAHWPIEVISGSLENTQALLALADQADVVIHLAGATAARSRAGYFKTNAAGTTLLVDAIKHAAPQAHVIHVSSLAARLSGLSNYSASKWAGEEIVRSSNLAWTIVRPPAVYGPQDEAMRPLWASLKRGLLPRIGPKDARFSLIYVQDLVEALTELAHPNALQALKGQTLELDDQFHGAEGPGYGWGDVARIAEQAFDRSVYTVPVPGTLLQVAAALSEGFGAITQKTPVFNRDKLKELGQRDWVCRPDPAGVGFKWSSRRQLSDTLKDLA